MSDSRRLRRSTEGGYACGDETRSKIIEAAIFLFGQHGFACASTRDIAANAGVNAPALQYYFDNKEGVYRACVESIVDEALLSLEPALRRAQQSLEDAASVPTLMDAFINLQCTLADLVFMKGRETDRRLFFARQQSGGEPEVGTQILQGRLRDPLNKISIALLARITGRPEQDPVTAVRMFSLFGQFLSFHVNRESTLSILGWSDIGGENAKFVRDNVSAQTRVLLQTWHRERATPRS